MPAGLAAPDTNAAAAARPVRAAEAADGEPETARPEPLLSVRDLTTTLHLDRVSAPAVCQVSFDLSSGETLGVVGESGCGKSMLALSLIGLHPRPVAEITSGRALFQRIDLVSLNAAALRVLRGRRIAMIFQEPMTALNPVMTIGQQIAEVLRRHLGLTGRRLSDRVVELLDQVQIPDPKRRARDYPHQLSGGMRQRAMIAMALACRPALLIADEPTTALDVTIQAQLLALLRQLQKETGMALMLITHDLGVIAEMADRVMVMYAGRKIEEGPVGRIFDSTVHPYARGLLASVPVIGARGRKRLSEIAGSVPSPTSLPQGCAFAPRCKHASHVCTERVPPFTEFGGGHRAACWHGIELAAARAR